MVPARPALFRFACYPAAALRAVTGANEGDPIGAGDAAIPGDTYRLVRGTVPARLAVAEASSGPCVADGSEVGRPGAPIAILACHMLMGPTGQLVEALLLRITEAEEDIRLHLLPLSPLVAGTEYDLVGSETAGAPERFADVASVSFLAGTQLTMADGAQRAVETLRVGERLLTRDHGPQPIRWIGQQTLRATGAAAPVRITAGTMNTARDLRLSPQHRLFVWQRHDAVGAGRAEVMVKAELLVNGTSVVREAGGHLDSYRLGFDGHEIIFAEGIAVESLLVGSGEATVPAPAALEVDERVLDPGDAAARLTRASRGEGAD